MKLTNTARWAPGLALALALAAPARAQEETKPVSTDPKAESEGMPEGNEVRPLPGWSIKPEMRKLDEQFKQFNSLIGSLNRANKDLSEEFQRYLKDPKNEVVGSSLERKMAAYAAQVSGDFDKVISDQDALQSNFRMLRRKLGQLSTHLGSKSGTFEERVREFRTKARDTEKKLIEMSIRLKEDPPQDPDEKRKLEREFARTLRSFNMQSRYATGYVGRYQNYLALRRNLEKLSDVFVALQEKFGDLIDNLSNEKQYLHDSIELQLDMIKIKQIMRDGIFGGDKAIKNVSEKLAELYVKVDAFTTIHDRINKDLNKFIDTQLDLTKLTDAIDEVGKANFGPGTSKTLEEAVDSFYKKRNEPSPFDEDILRGKEGSADAPK